VRVEKLQVPVGWVNGVFRYEERTLLIHEMGDDYVPPDESHLTHTWSITPCRATESFPRCTTEVPIPDEEQWLPQWDELLPGERIRARAVCAITGEEWDPHRHPRDQVGPPPGRTYRQHLHRVLAQQLAWYMAGRRRTS